MNSNLAEEPTAVSRQGDLNIQQTILLSAPGSVLIKTTLVKEARYRQLYQQTDKSANRFLVGPTLLGAKRPQ